MLRLPYHIQVLSRILVYYKQHRIPRSQYKFKNNPIVTSQGFLGPIFLGSPLDENFPILGPKTIRTPSANPPAIA